MPRHSYRAALASGHIQRGELDALNLADLEARLARLGLTLINGEPVRHRRPLWRPRVARGELAHFCFQLEHLLAAGVPILDGLAELRDSLTHAGFRSIVASLGEAIAAGQTLSAACAAHPETFDAVFVGLLRAGEEAGRLPQVLHDLAADLERADELAAHARRIAIYPAVVAAILLAAVGVALVFVIPEVARLFQGIGQALPLQTRILIAVSHWVAAYGWLLLGAVVAGALAARGAIARSPALRLRYHAMLLRLPLLGPLLRKLLLARFCTVLALLYEAGIPIVDALRTAAETAGNAALRRTLHEAGARIAEGRSLSEALAAVTLFPPLVVRMLRTGEHSGALDAALGRIGGYYQREVRESIDALQAAMEPALTVVLGGLMLWIMSAVLGPIYDILGRLPL